MKEEIFTSENSMLPQSGQEKSVGQLQWVWDFPVGRAVRQDRKLPNAEEFYGLRRLKRG
jgi:hypothetical protein